MRACSGGYIPAPFGGARKKKLNAGLMAYLAKKRAAKGGAGRKRKGGFLGPLAMVASSILPGIVERIFRRKEGSSRRRRGGLTRDGKKPMKGLLGSASGGRRRRRSRKWRGMGSSAGYGPSI